MTGQRPVGLSEAAARLGLSLEATRMRLRRGTLVGEKTGRTWQVYLPAADGQPVATEQRLETDRTTGQDGILAELRADVAFLRAELERRSVELAEMRRLLAVALPQLPAPENATTRAVVPENPPVATESAPRPRSPWWAFWRAWP